MLKLYEKYHISRERTLIGLFREINKHFNPKRILYPGSFVHITPSLIFSNVTYIDSVKGVNKFFEDPEVNEYIINNKEYSEKTNLKFYHQDYYEEIPERLGSYDYVISLYGGFIGQAVKKYLIKGGILVCNDSHGDASMASKDPDYKLIAVYDEISDEDYSISYTDLDEYLIPKKRKNVSKKEMQKIGRGIVYTRSPTGYIFRKK